MRQRIQLVVIAVFAVALSLAAAYTYVSFVSPLTFTSSVHLPFVVNNWYEKPDRRFGVVEITYGDAALLGLVKSNYISGQWRLPLEGDNAVFFRPTERPHPNSWLLCSWSDGWYDEDGCRRWVREHPGFTYIVGNELSLGGDIGDGDVVSVPQYARWYHDARGLIEEEDPTAIVAPYGPCGGAGGLLFAVWDSYLEQYGELMPVDFYVVHHYCLPVDGPEWCWTKLTHWIGWLESHRGLHWVGPQNYWLTEWGLPAWSDPAPLVDALSLMEGMTLRLKNNAIGITNHAWWPSCNLEWRDQCTLLVRGGQVTELGRRYLELAND